VVKHFSRKDSWKQKKKQKIERFYVANIFANCNKFKFKGFSLLHDSFISMLVILPSCNPTILFPRSFHKSSTASLANRLAKSLLLAVGLPPLWA
jgi:hypothetical protein